MESDGSEIDDLADIELSTFAIPGQQHQHQDDEAWRPHVISTEVKGKGDNQLITSANNGLLIDSDLPELRDVDGIHSTAVDQRKYPLSPSSVIDQSIDWNAANTTNPFRKSTGDLPSPSPSPSNPFRSESQNSTSNSPDSNPFSPNSSQLHPPMKPSNPFLEQSPNNPFRSQRQSSSNENNSNNHTPTTTTTSDPFGFPDASCLSGPTEYVYMSRLPGENIGMVLGIDGDQENRFPVKGVHVKSITPGGAAARACEGSNRIFVGDEIREIDGKPLNRLTHDECIGLLQEMPDTVVLTVYRQQQGDHDHTNGPIGDKENAPIDSFDLNPERGPFTSSHVVAEVAGELCKSDAPEVPPTSAASKGRSLFHHQLTSRERRPSDTTSSDVNQIPKGFVAVGVTLYKKESDSLGISIVPSYGATCDLYQIKRLLPGGACAQVQRLEIGDRLLTCNGQSLRSLGQAQCLQVLKSAGTIVDLTVLKPSAKLNNPSANADHNASLLVPSHRQRDPTIFDVVAEPHDKPQLSPPERDSTSPRDDENLLNFETGHDDFKLHHQRDIDCSSDLLFDDNVNASNPNLLDGLNEECPNQIEELIFPREDNLINIPPPVEFSDVTLKNTVSAGANEFNTQECVTNIDDLLFLDTAGGVTPEFIAPDIDTPQFDAHSSNVVPEKEDDEPIDFGHDPSLDTGDDNHDDDLIALGSKSIEEFAEKIFDSITEQILLDSAQRSSDISKQSVNPFRKPSEHLVNDSERAPDVSFQSESSNASHIDKGTHVTVLNVVPQSQKHISSIPIPTARKQLDNAPVLSSSLSPSPSTPPTESRTFSTIIPVNKPVPEARSRNVTKIDVNVPLSSSKSKLPPTPPPRSNHKNSGSVIFHTHADINPTVPKSTTITLNGESPKTLAAMNGQPEVTKPPCDLGSQVHTTIGVPTTSMTGEEEELIQPMSVAKDDQGKLLCVASTRDKTTTSAKEGKTFDSSNLSGLVDSLAKHGSQFDEDSPPCDDDENGAGEEQIVPTVLTRGEEEIINGVLNKWQDSDGNDKPNVFQTTVSALIKSENESSISGGIAHTTIGVSSMVNNGEDEEHIVPMAALRNHTGKPMCVPASPKAPSQDLQKDMSGFLNIASTMLDHDKMADQSQEILNDSHEDGENVAEDAIVPTVLSKKQTEMAFGVIDSWNSGDAQTEPETLDIAATRFMRGANLTPQNSFVHTTLGVNSTAQSGEEEEIIQPMFVSKDLQGKPLRTPSAPHVHSQDKLLSQATAKDMSGVINIASTMLDRDTTTDQSQGMLNDSHEDGENVAEDAIVPTVLSKKQTEMAFGVIDSWNSRDAQTEPETLDKAATKFMRGANLTPQNSFVHTTLGVNSTAQSGEEEEIIQPMRVSKDLQGKPICAPSSQRSKSPDEEKDMSGLLNIASTMMDNQTYFDDFSNHETASQSEDISEEEIVPTVLSKDQAGVARSVLQGWNGTNYAKENTVQKAAAGFFRGANMSPTSGMVHSTLGVQSSATSGEEEEAIKPMTMVKDHQGKPLWVPLSEPKPRQNSERVLNMAALNGFVEALESSTLSQDTNGDISGDDEEIVEDDIKPVKMTSDQKEVVSKVIDKWSAIDENPSLLCKAASLAKSSNNQKQLDALDSSLPNVAPKIQNGNTVHVDIPKKSINSDDTKDTADPSTLSTSDVIHQSKTSSGQKNSYRQAVSVFEQDQNKKSDVPTDSVVLRAKLRQSVDFKVKLQEFQKQEPTAISGHPALRPLSASSAKPRPGQVRPKSMFEVSSSKPTFTPQPSGGGPDRSSAFKPLSTIKALGPSIATKRASITLSDRPGSTLLSQSPRVDYPKTRQEDGSPFQQDVLAGIVGLGLKVKVIDGYAVISDIQRSGPLGKSGNVKVGDFLLSVNGKELTGQTDSRVQQNLRLLPRGLVKLVVAGKKPQDADSPSKAPDEASGDLLSSSEFIGDEESSPSSHSATPPTTATFIASANGIQRLTSHDLSSSLTDLNLAISTSSSDLPPSDDHQPPLTARIEISPGNQRGTPMKIAIKPAPTPRPVSGGMSRPTPMPRFAYASSTNESWDTSSEDSTPREPRSTMNNKPSNTDIIASQKRPDGHVAEESLPVSDGDNPKDSGDTENGFVSSPNQVEKEVEVEDAIVQKTVGNVNSAPKTSELTKISSNPDPVEIESKPIESPRKVPPPVAPKPRLSSSSSAKSDDLSSSPSPKPDDINENEGKPPVATKSTSKISAGYERLQALAKAKPAKPSRVIEKSRTFVSSTAKLFDNKAGEEEDSSKNSPGSASKPEVNRINSSLLPLNKRRQSTGSAPFSSKPLPSQVPSSYHSSLSRPKSLNPKGNALKEVPIPETTSPRDDGSPDGKSVKSPTRMNSALSPRRASSVDLPSSVAFKFSPTTAPKVDTTFSSQSIEGKTLKSALSPQSTKDKIDSHKITSSYSSPSHVLDSRSHSLSKTDSPSQSDDKASSQSLPFRNRSKSSSSVLPSRSTSFTTPINEEVLEDTMKKFDDLLMDAPYSHTETDPSELLLWTPVRKDSPSIAKASTKTRSDPQPTTATKQEVEKPVVPPRGKPSVSDRVGKSSIDKASLKNEVSSVPEPSNDKADESIAPITPIIDSSISKELEMEAPMEKNVEEEIVTPSVRVNSECKPTVNEPQIKELPMDFENLIQNSSHKDDNIPASSLVKEILSEESQDVNQSKSLISDTQNENLVSSENADSSVGPIVLELGDKGAIETNQLEDTQKLEALFNSEIEQGDLSQNIPADLLASDIENEEKTSTAKEPLVSLEEFQNTECLNSQGKDNDSSFNQDTEFVSGINPKDDEAYHEQAKLIVDCVFDVISKDPNVLSTNDEQELEDGVDSPASSEDEPPPLPGAPPPPIILRQNSVLLTEREWLEDSEDVMTDSKTEEVQGMPPPTPDPDEGDVGESNTPETSNEIEAVEEVINEAQVTCKEATPSVENGLASQISQLSSRCEDFELNIVGQDIAAKIKGEDSYNAEEESVNESFSATNITCQETSPSVEVKFDSQLNQLSSDHNDFSLNIVGQNTALAIEQDHNLFDEEEGQSRSDSLEPLNSTGDSCHDGYALRVNSPNSMDVLSEDSGMPADEEFQEVNTDDTISPSNELKDFTDLQTTKVTDCLDHSQSSKGSESLSEPVTLHASPVENVDNVLESSTDEPQSPPPMLPSSAPPDFLTSSNPSDISVLDISSDPQAKPSDFQPSSKEVILNGDDNLSSDVISPDFISVEMVSPTPDENLLSADAKEVIPLEECLSLPSCSEPSETVAPEVNSETSQKEEIDKVSVNKGEPSVKDDGVSDSKVISERKWELYSNKSEPNLISRGEPGSTITVSFTEETLQSSISIPDFAALLSKANETLDSLKAPKDAHIQVVHLHREGDSVPLGVELKPDQEFWYKVTVIRENSPTAKLGSVSKGDYLLTIDNLWCTQCSLMRCMARLTKPKHNSVLVLARLAAQVDSTGESSSLETPPAKEAVQSERPVVAPRSTRTQAPLVKPRQTKSPTSRAPPPLSPSTLEPEKQTLTETTETVSLEKPQSKEVTNATGSPHDEGGDSPAGNSGLLDVVMMKGATGVGFCLEGGVGSPKGNLPIAIKRIFKGGPAEKCGQLKVKDEILEVNGLSFEGMRHYEAWNHLKFLDDGEVHLKIRRPE